MLLRGPLQCLFTKNLYQLWEVQLLEESYCQLGLSSLSGSDDPCAYSMRSIVPALCVGLVCNSGRSRRVSKCQRNSLATNQSCFISWLIFSRKCKRWGYILNSRKISKIFSSLTTLPNNLFLDIMHPQTLSLNLQPMAASLILLYLLDADLTPLWFP